MVFNSNVFLFCFLPVVFSLFWLARTKQQRYVLLTLSGFIFYSYWNWKEENFHLANPAAWKYTFLLLFSSVVSFCAGLLIDRADSKGRKRALMIAAVSVDLAVLAYFKYFNFIAGTLTTVSGGFIPSIVHQVVLPVGISFYTFHTMSYVIDVAAGRVRATRNVFEYLTYVSLFSQLVAGPIVRFRQIEGDLERIDGKPKYDNMAIGVGYFIAGFVKKVMIADAIAHYIDPLLLVHQSLSPGAAWICAIGYALQIYYDFSGYSDMAIGLGLLFGLHIPINFNSPYKAEGIQDFWRRWHISLSSWLRDYLYIPLGGNRKGQVRMNANLMITMLLGGLWHGVTWMFVLWGGLHGLLLILDRLVQPWFSKLPMLARRWTTFFVIVLTWVPFRSKDWEMCFTWLRTMFGFASPGLHPQVSANLIAACFLGLILVNTVPETHQLRFPVRVRWAVVYAVVFFIAYLFMNSQESVFLYYQF
ncbi:MAG: alginate O-acetyltransferase complex protein AlgI [Fimbriimonadaceae bacterium]|jgi:alginate O-acetyltransferase complex protein AlgI|nr:alginate O-acetyltransferase complex protein AlgI [Fimbriimonadaceae bacterium]